MSRRNVFGLLGGPPHCPPAGVRTTSNHYRSTGRQPGSNRVPSSSVTTSS